MPFFSKTIISPSPSRFRFSNASATSASTTAGGSLYTIETAGSTTPGSVATKFNFLSPTPANPLTALAALGMVKASFTFLGSASSGQPDTPANHSEYQALTSGSFSFIYTGVADLHVHHDVYHTGANLLTATFGGGSITGRPNATSGNVDGSTTSGDTITYTSDFLDFSMGVDADFAIAVGAMSPRLGATVHQAVNTFFGTTTGSFSSDPQPGVVALVPEPAAWSLFVVGFGLIGFQTRRRARSTIVIA